MHGRISFIMLALLSGLSACSSKKREVKYYSRILIEQEKLIGEGYSTDYECDTFYAASDSEAKFTALKKFLVQKQAYEQLKLSTGYQSRYVKEVYLHREDGAKVIVYFPEKFVDSLEDDIRKAISQKPE